MPGGPPTAHDRAPDSARPFITDAVAGLLRHFADPGLEKVRAEALRHFDILETPPSESFDRITRMASQLFGLPIAALSLSDGDRQWFKSRVGIEHWSIPREAAPCALVADSAEILLIPDLAADDVYRNGMLAEQGIRFYAGAPLVTRQGLGLGALCVWGTEPRTTTSAELGALTDLAAMAMSQIEFNHAFQRIDSVSGLPNRAQFFEDLDKLGSDHAGENLLIALMDIAEIEQLDSGVRVLGCTFLDGITKDISKTIRNAMESTEIAYHVAATQFAFLTSTRAGNEQRGDKLVSKLEKLCEGWNTRMLTTAAVGIAPFVAGRDTPQEIMRIAHSAVQDARTSNAIVGVYSPTSDDSHRRRYRLLNDFGAALEDDGQLRLVYQPRIDLVSDRCVGAETLLRWRHPDLGDISPAEFIPIVEQTAFSRQITSWVLDTALGQFAAWRKRGHDFALSVNVSATNLDEPDFASRVQLYLLKHSIPPQTLEIEVTESAVMGDRAQAAAQLAALREAGVRLAIDDFGTGYSNLSYLQQLPASVIKIDRSFIFGLDSGERENALVRSMITLSHQLNHRVVAEGVETALIADVLRAMGCDEAQGYFFARPLETIDLEQWLNDAISPNPVSCAA